MKVFIVLLVSLQVLPISSFSQIRVANEFPFQKKRCLENPVAAGETYSLYINAQNEFTRRVRQEISAKQFKGIYQSNGYGHAINSTNISDYTDCFSALQTAHFSLRDREDDGFQVIELLSDIAANHLGVFPEDAPKFLKMTFDFEANDRLYQSNGVNLKAFAMLSAIIFGLATLPGEGTVLATLTQTQIARSVTALLGYAKSRYMLNFGRVAWRVKITTNVGPGIVIFKHMSISKKVIKKLGSNKAVKFIKAMKNGICPSATKAFNCIKRLQDHEIKRRGLDPNLKWYKIKTRFDEGVLGFLEESNKSIEFYKIISHL